MLDVGWTEILVIAVVLIVVVGPKDLPHMLRQFGRTTAKMRAMAGDFRKQFDEALKEAELDDVRDLAKQARSLDPRQTIRKHLNPLEKAGQDIKAGLDAAMKPKADSSAEPAAPAAHVVAPAKAGPVGKAKPAAKPAGSSATKKRATRSTAGAKTAAARTDMTKSPKASAATAGKANGAGVAKPATKSSAESAAKPAAKPTAKAKGSSPATRKARAASASRKQDKPGSAT